MQQKKTLKLKKINVSAAPLHLVFHFEKGNNSIFIL